MEDLPIAYFQCPTLFIHIYPIFDVMKITKFWGASSSAN